MTHRGDNRYSICKQLTQTSHVKTHMVVHSGEKQLRCTVWGKWFRLVDELKLHNNSSSRL